MCEFCTEHGEGKKWYLQMKNYADALLHEQLSSAQKDIVGAPTRFEWNNRFLESFVMPATGSATKMEEEPQSTPPPAEPSTPQPSEDEIVARQKVQHFGQVLPIEDVEQVIDMVDSITRMPCGCRFITTGKADKRYCFGFGIDRFGILGRFPDTASSLEVLLGKVEKWTVLAMFKVQRWTLNPCRGSETEWTILSFHQMRISMTCFVVSGTMWMSTSS